MALTTVADHQLAINRILWFLDTVHGGVNPAEFLVNTGMLKGDFDVLAAAFVTYKKTRKARPTAYEVTPSGHGDNQTTLWNGDSAVQT
jgi:hypothetical protein